MPEQGIRLSGNNEPFYKGMNHPYPFLMKYTYTFPVAYQEVDKSRRWRLHNLENMLLQVAGDVANRLGFGIDALLPYGYTWILARMEVRMDRLPTHGETITVETWIEQNAHMLSTRNYRIYEGTDTTAKQIGQVSSVWAVLDMNTRQAVNAFDLPMFEGCVDGERLNMERAPRMASLTTPTGEADYTIAYSDIDYNGHCNSCKYLEHMIDACRPAFMEQATPFRLSLQYNRELFEGEQTRIRYMEGTTQDGNLMVQWQMLSHTGDSAVLGRYIQLQ